MAVCGGETFTLAASPKELSYAPSATIVDALTQTESGNAFTTTDPDNFCNDDSEYDRQKLYTDTGGVTSFSHTQIWLDELVGGPEHPIKVNLETPTATPVIFYLVEKSYQGSSVSPAL